MQLLRRRPGPPLSDFVDVIWAFEGAQGPHKLERLLPDGSTELVITLDEDAARIYHRVEDRVIQTLPGSLVAGPHSQYFVIDTAGQCSTIGIHFKPGGAYPFLGVPSVELHDSHVALDALWGSFVRELRERVLEACTMTGRLVILEQALLARASRPLALHPAVRFALDEFQTAPHMRTVSAVTEDLGLSPRRFIEVFREQVGMTPKLFCRVRRFQRAVQSIAAGRKVEWTEVALESGYFDQAHFNHDFREFSGFTPTEYAARVFRHANHVPL